MCVLSDYTPFREMSARYIENFFCIGLTIMLKGISHPSDHTEILHNSSLRFYMSLSEITKFMIFILPVNFAKLNNKSTPLMTDAQSKAIH